MQHHDDQSHSSTNNRPYLGADWSIESAKQLYNIDRWGQGYFTINESGELCILPKKNSHTHTVSIFEVVKEIKRHNIPFPVTVRFHDILRNQVKILNKTFRHSIEEAKFKGKYYGVYPIKVNQMREVVEEVLDAGAPYNHGLEAGSKAELLAVLALNSNPNSLTILNGYKDRDYLRLALLGRKLGRKIIIVVEKFSELKDIIKLSKEMDITPLIGLRANLSAKGTGRWEKSSGHKAKFGLSIAEVVEAVRFLEKHNALDCFKLFHFHIGSQVTDIRAIKDAITEGARIYSKLKKMNSALEYFDVGGGLGVDYDGSKSASNSSINYELKDYVEDVVYILKQICDIEEVDHPHIVSESGRAVTAHHSCVITNVFGKVEPSASEFCVEKSPGDHVLVDNMREIYEDIKKNNIQESYNDAASKIEECIQAFKLGILDLEERAKAETLYWKICQRIWEVGQDQKFSPEDIQDLNDKLAKQYLCNFSVFQSTIDSWGVGQLLPVVPIHRLDERPTQSCTLADITCDSDGKIDKFIDFEDVKNTLELHHLNQDEEYFLGIFLTGAYQDILGDMHNLFGRPNEVHVYSDHEDPSGFYIEEVIRGNSTQDVLTPMQYSPQSLAQTIKKEIDRQVARGKIRPREGVKLTDFYESCLSGYTYLKH